MTDVSDRSASQAAQKIPASDAASGVEPAPLCFVLEEEPSIRHFLSLILHGSGVDTEEFVDGASFRQAIASANRN
jgi:hypothetical protein